MYENMLEIIKWWASHLLFMLIINLSAFGAYHAYAWYQTMQPTAIDVSQYDDDSLNRISKEVFQEQDRRQQS